MITQINRGDQVLQETSTLLRDTIWNKIIKSKRTNFTTKIINKYMDSNSSSLWFNIIIKIRLTSRKCHSLSTIIQTTILLETKETTTGSEVETWWTTILPQTEQDHLHINRHLCSSQTLLIFTNSSFLLLSISRCHSRRTTNLNISNQIRITTYQSNSSKKLF